MPAKIIHQSLQQLRGTVAEGGVDPRLGPSLEELASELELRLRTGEVADLDKLGDAVKDLITRLESEHPGAAAILSNIASALTSMGV